MEANSVYVASDGRQSCDEEGNWKEEAESETGGFVGGRGQRDSASVERDVNHAGMGRVSFNVGTG